MYHKHWLVIIESNAFKTNDKTTRADIATKSTIISVITITNTTSNTTTSSTINIIQYQQNELTGKVEMSQCLIMIQNQINAKISTPLRAAVDEICCVW